jgi:hypothetical protein
MASPDPRLYVDPADNEFTTSSPLGTEFTVTIKTADWVNPVFSYQLKLYFNNTLLNATFADIPTGHWLTPTVRPTNFFIADLTVDNEAGFVSFAGALLNPEQGKTGGGTIATITFQIMAVPPSGENFTSALEFRNVKIVDPTATAYPADQYQIVNGVYVYSAVAPPITGGDLNADGKVDIQDVAIWGLAFGSTPTSSRWNPIADMNGDNEINIVDAVLICQNWTI